MESDKKSIKWALSGDNFLIGTSNYLRNDYFISYHPGGHDRDENAVKKHAIPFQNGRNRKR